jgi:hypothetical protein
MRKGVDKTPNLWYNVDTNQERKVIAMKKVKILVDWSNSEVISKEEFETRQAKELEWWAKDEDSWNDWLANKYYLREVFNMTEEEKKKVRAEYLDDAENRVLEEIMEELEWVTIDLEDVIFIED